MQLLANVILIKYRSIFGFFFLSISVVSEKHKSPTLTNAKNIFTLISALNSYYCWLFACRSPVGLSVGNNRLNRFSPAPLKNTSLPSFSLHVTSPSLNHQPYSHPQAPAFHLLYISSPLRLLSGSSSRQRKASEL